ncbi:MAG TPA: 3',5'-cyclic-nucleotide phosphodiesterase [Vicinamibacteria bacterium]|jgi:3',5'-cyclic-nucleotide phosphodiesterase|nr:3',5'-cyclic-nucleotide phosphodiesterase [Vicinamibacteria bacterium]
MKLRVLGCYGGNIPGHGMTSLLINGSVALDAGWVSGALSLKEQVKVKDILISHSHLDHTCTLPFLIDNNFSAPGFALRIYAIPEVVASMKNHLFNNHTWPDFTCLPNDLTPVLKLVEVTPEQPFTINGLTVRPVLVSHIVPTAGFIVEDKKGAIAFSSDTGPTERFWELVNTTKRLRAVITETSFPNELQDLANISGHLTPNTLEQELKKLKKDVPVYLYGGKPKHLKKIKKEVKALKQKRLKLLVQGRTYKF